MIKNCEICRNSLNTGKRFCSYRCYWGKKIIKKCETCKKEFKTYSCRIKAGVGRFCSPKCSYISRGGSLYLPNLPNKNNIHKWIVKMRGKSKDGECEMKDETCSKLLDWSNISGEYKRDLSDWQILCRRHHVIFDYTDTHRERISRGFLKNRVTLRLRRINKLLN